MKKQILNKAVFFYFGFFLLVCSNPLFAFESWYQTTGDPKGVLFDYELNGLHSYNADMPNTYSFEVEALNEIRSQLIRQKKLKNTPIVFYLPYGGPVEDPD